MQRRDRSPGLSFVLCHGWGFSPSFWQPLLSHLCSFAPCYLWDLGYFGPPSFPYDPQSRTIAIGHSLGFHKLLLSPYSFDLLIGINAFIQFCSSPTSPLGYPTENVDRLRSSLIQRPHKTLQLFQTQCGYKEDAPKIPAVGVHRLLEDLDFLKSSSLTDHLQHKQDQLLLLHTHRDPILPVNLFTPMWASLPVARHLTLNDTHHVLGFKAADTVAKVTCNFLTHAFPL